MTLVVLGLVAWGFLRLLHEGTRQVSDARDLAGAASTLRRDLLAASLGPLPLADAVVPRADNSAAAASLALADGRAAAVLAGTDQLELAGFLRAPLLSLDALDCESREAYASAGAGQGLLKRDPRRARLRIPVARGPRGGQRAELERLTERLREGAGAQLFLVADSARHWAVGKVVAYERASLDRGNGPCGGFVELTLDFGDADAVRQSPRRDPRVLDALGDVRAGGLLDRLVYFVAGGEHGAAPYLAVGEYAGAGRYRVARLAEGVTDLQVAYGIAAADGRFDPAERPPDVGPDDWWPNLPGEHPATPELLRDALGRSRLRSVKVALVAGEGQHEGEPPKPMNGSVLGEKIAAAEQLPRPGWRVETVVVDLPTARDSDP